MGGNDVIGHVKSFPRTFGAAQCIQLNEGMHACRVPEITELRRPANPRDKEPKPSDLGVTRRNPDIVRDSEGSLGRHFRPEAPGSPHREAMDPLAREPCVLVHSPFRRA
jgi:hypothetical protein